MTLATKQIEPIEGRTIEEISQALHSIANQLEKMDDILKFKTDQEVWKLFLQQQQTMDDKMTKITALIYENRCEDRKLMIK
jgi:hypothetical protein